MVRMALEVPDKIAIVALVFSVFFAILNYLYTRRKTQPQPRIYISRVKPKVTYAERKDKKPTCSFNILFRNSGEISTFVDVNIFINVRPIIPFHTKTKEDQIHTLVSGSEKYEYALDAGQNDPRSFSFDLHENAKNWKEGTLMISGTYLGYKDRERHIMILFKGKREDERWKPVIYIVEEDTILGYIKRKIRLIQAWNQKRKYRKISKNATSIN